MNENVYEWLLEPCDSSVRYRTLTELMDEKDSKEALEAKNAIPGSGPAKRLMETMHQDGYWLQKNYKGEILGQGVEYGSFATTHFCLSYCAELGLDRNTAFVERAADRYLGLQKEDGDWWEHLSCLFCYNIRTFVMLGYRGDERVQKAIYLMLRTDRPDGGYLCDLHDKRKGRPEKSCVRGAAKALLAFAELPEYRNHERCLQLVDYFLDRNGIFKRSDRGRFVNKDVMSDSFPIVWRTNTWEILYALSKLGYGRDERLDDAWEAMESRKDGSGRYLLSWTPAQSPWKAGITGEPNKWITLYCLLAEKYRERGE